MQEDIFNRFLLDKLKIIFTVFVDLLMNFKENLNTICTFIGAKYVHKSDKYQISPKLK